MSDPSAAPMRRPPPPPPRLPVRAAPATTVARPTARPLPGEAPAWRPQPWPTLMKDAVPRVEGFAASEPDQRAQLIDKEASWSGVLIWGFGVVVLLLVVMPTTAIPKLLGPSSLPVSGAAYGPI